jgi:UPF0755 protein
VILLAVIAFLMFTKIISAVNDSTNKLSDGTKVEVTIAKNAGARDIAQTLESNGLINDSSAFLDAAKAKNKDTLLLPGKYVFTVGMTNEQLVDALAAGPSETGAKLTIREGLTIEQTAQVVEQTCGIPAADFTNLAHKADAYVKDYPFLDGVYNNSLEGFLYPATYSVPDGASADDVIRMLLTQFSVKTANVDWSYADSHGLSHKDVIAIASMIEREAGTEAERPLVSSVIYNRLALGMKLQICSTVVYVLGPDARDYGANPLLYVDLNVDSPYNTYLHDGLPPGPICSPRLSSIEAAAAPAQTKYLYYVLTSTDRTHTFCATAEEFEAANQVYREVFGIK